MSKKIALVTGASSGIGKAIACNLVNAGYNVIGTSTTEVGVIKLNKMFEGQGKHLAIKMNVVNKEDIFHAKDLIKEVYGTAPLILINNAGIIDNHRFQDMSYEAWQKVIDTNLNGVFHIIKCFIDDMQNNFWGRIVNISSIVAYTGSRDQTNYVASKAALVGFSKSLAQEFASNNITVNCIAPGFINTDMTAQLSEERLHHFIKKIPIQRMGTPEEVAHVVKFLISELSGYITGETIHVNGGLYML